MISFLYLKIITICIIILCINIFFLKKWLKVSNFFSLISNPTNRGLHDNPISTSGGIIFILYLLLILIFNFFFLINDSYFFIIIFGGLLTLIYGIADDKLNLKPLKKYFAQSILAIFILILNKKGFFSIFLNLNYYNDLIFTYIFIITVFNASNFIDGADGTLLFFKIYIIVIFVLLYLDKNLNINNIFFILLLILFLIPLLYFNITKKIFIGESGSFFIGLFIIIIFMYSINNNIMSIKHWLLVGSYFFWDILVTFLLRIFYFGKKAFVPHKTHAYQNFINLKKNHQKFNYILIFYKIFISIPIILFFNQEKIDFFFAFVMISIPPLIFILKYSPLIRKL